MQGYTTFQHNLRPEAALISKNRYDAIYITAH